MSHLHKILGEMPSRGASDLHVRTNAVPVFRIHGILFRLKDQPFKSEEILNFLADAGGDRTLETFKADKEVDFGFTIAGVGRYRINAYQQKGQPALAVRLIKLQIPDFDSLKLPSVIKDISLRARGMILVTGATGSGKSTALAGIINHINLNRVQNIITLEDPIEYLHEDKKSIISQREIGRDTRDFPAAMRSALRQDPDVILIGEIRDYHTMQTALAAANTGHLVFSTLHTMSATETINRVLSFYPAHQQDEARILLSSALLGILSLRLLPGKDNKSRIPACEVLINTALVRDLLLHQKSLPEIKKAVEEGYSQHGSQSFDQCLLNLYNDDLITYEVAYRNASNPDDFELRSKGIEGTSDRSWLSA